jgi:hypothetical protein
MRPREGNVNISSFNITEVGYHYIGLRVLAATPEAAKEEQNTTISRSVLKYARDKALRLMLPEPKSTFEAVGEKICQELAHFEYAEATKGRGYELTAAGMETLGLLNDKNFLDLRRRMALVHLKTYANLQAVVHVHIAQKGILSPQVETGRKIDAVYLAALLRPSFGALAESEAEGIIEELKERSPKQVEDALRERVLRKLITQHSVSVPLFRAMCDRLVSLRLLNAMRVSRDKAEFSRTYSPCVEGPPARKWHHRCPTTLCGGGTYTIYLSEPDFEDEETRQGLMTALDAAYSTLEEQAGYFDLPDVRDFVCESLSIPEAAFDEGILALLDLPKPPVTLGLTYERITGRRKPLVRVGESTQIYNLIRRA